MPNLVTGRVGLSEMPGIYSNPGFAIQNTDLDVGAIRPNSIGLMCKNASGLDFPAGTMVYQSGWDLASGFPVISLATAASELKAAQWVTAQAIANGATGLLSQHYAMTGLNTNANTVGDAVYLSTIAGGVNVTTPTAASLIYQIVGHVAVKSATVGVIHIDLLNAAITPIFRANIPLPAIATTGVTSACVKVPFAGTIISAKAVFPTSLGINGTNFVIVSAVDLITGSGTNQLLAAGATVNSTFTGGTAITADTDYALTLSGTPANLVIAANDTLKAVITVTGTLGGALAAGGLLSFQVMPT